MLLILRTQTRKTTRPWPLKKSQDNLARGNELQWCLGQEEADLAKLILICREVANFADSIQSDQNSLWNCEALRPGNGRTSYNESWIQPLPAQDRIITSRPDIAYGVPRHSCFLISRSLTPWCSGQGIIILEAASSSRTSIRRISFADNTVNRSRKKALKLTQ